MPSLENTHPRDFYDRATPKVARELLGSFLCRRLPDGTILRARIVETEAYRYTEPACHAARGITPRTAIMFGKSGMSYVYFIYGVYHCLNVVTEPEGDACAVLIRAIETDGGDGPGKLCRSWDIDRRHNGIDLTDSRSQLWIEQGQPPQRSKIGVSPRIGITSAQDLMWRFYIKEHPHVSGMKSTKRRSPAAVK